LSQTDDTNDNTDDVVDDDDDVVLEGARGSLITPSQPRQRRRVTTPTVAQGRIAAAADIDPSYSPAGVNMRPHITAVSWDHLRPYPKRQVDRFIRFCRTYQCVKRQ